MSDTIIKVGDRVSWVEEYHFKCTRTHLCKVVSLSGNLAVIDTRDRGTLEIHVGSLTKLAPTATEVQP